MTTPTNQPVDLTYLDQITEALLTGVPVDSQQLAWALGQAVHAVRDETLTDWEARARIAVLVLGGASYADLLRALADELENNAPVSTPPAPDPAAGLLTGPPPPLPGTQPAPAVQATQAAPVPAPPAQPQSAKAAKSTPGNKRRSGGRQGMVVNP